MIRFRWRGGSTAVTNPIGFAYYVAKPTRVTDPVSPRIEPDGTGSSHTPDGVAGSVPTITTRWQAMGSRNTIFVVIWQITQ